MCVHVCVYVYIYIYVCEYMYVYHTKSVQYELSFNIYNDEYKFINYVGSLYALLEYQMNVSQL